MIIPLFNYYTLKFVSTYTYTPLFLIFNILHHVYLFNDSSNVVAILCQLPATSNPKTVGGMCYAIIGLTVIGLTSHHSANYK